MLQALFGEKCEVCGGVSASFERSRASKSGGTCFASLPKSNKSTQDTSERKMRFLFAGSSRCVERATKHPAALHHQETLMTMATGNAVRLAFETAGVEFVGESGWGPLAVALDEGSTKHSARVHQTILPTFVPKNDICYDSSHFRQTNRLSS